MFVRDHPNKLADFVSKGSGGEGCERMGRAIAKCPTAFVNDSLIRMQRIEQFKAP